MSLSSLVRVIVALAAAWVAPAPAAEPPSDAKLDAYVDAALAAEAASRPWQWRLAEARSQREASILLEAAKRDATDAVERTPGITAVEYHQITATLEVDGELKARLRRMIQDRAHRLAAEERFDALDQLRGGILRP
jgi:hypothetical protein